MQGFLQTPWNATSRTTAQDALWQHILNRNTSSQPFMTPCARQVMNRIPGDLTPSWAGCWGPHRSYLMSEAIYSPAEKSANSKADPPQTETPHSTLKSEPPQSGGSSRSSPPGPAFSLQREYLTVVAHRGPLGGSWSGFLWLSYTSRGRKPKLRFLTSSPRRASWCLESRLTHHHGITPPPIYLYLLITVYKSDIMITLLWCDWPVIL